MQIVLNGKPFEIKENATVDDLLQELDLQGKLAVEINREIIPRSTFRSRPIRAGDEIEIVRAIGGG